ncbi:MAG: PfkB family carbohydrate kinase, partial [Parvibaculales bacterium]
LFAAHTIRANGGRVGLSLADAQCVDRHRDMLKNLLTDKIDIVLANEAEALALAQSDTIDDINATAAWLHAQKPDGGLDGAITLSAKGALVLGAKPHHVAAEKIDDVVDLTGAGDQFAAGFLGGLMHGKSPQQAAEIGVIMASEVIRHFGPRPQHDIKKVMAAHNLHF